MKVLKILIALILFVFGTITIVQMASEESGEALYGALAGYGIILLISGMLTYSATRNQSDNNKAFSIGKKNNSNLNEQQLNLKILKDKNVLTNNEYREKINLLNSKMIFESKEYISLKSLLDNGLFTNQEFDVKVQELLKTSKKYDELTKPSQGLNHPSNHNPNKVLQESTPIMSWKPIIIIIVIAFLGYLTFGVFFKLF